MSNKVGYIFNAVIIVLATIIGATYPQVGSILGYVGSVIGLGLIYIIPIAVYLKRYRMRMEDPDLVKALDENKIKTVSGAKDISKSPVIAYDQGNRKRALPLNSSSLVDTNELSLNESLLNRGLKPLPLDFRKYYFI
jgi:hypothetical protein